MRDKPNIAILDDREDILQKWIDDLTNLGVAEKGFRLLSVDGKIDFQVAITQLETRRAAIRAGEKLDPVIGEAEFDQFDVLIIDYDLLEMGERGFFTGEDVAYLARCFSRCGIILALNQFGQNTFDLTLKGHLESFADLNIGADQLANPNLWGLPGTRFRPWIWPVIPDFLKRLDRRIEDAMEHLDDPILPFLNFEPEDIDTLPREMVASLQLLPDENGTSSKSPREITFRDLARHSPLGLAARDEPVDDEQMAHIAAARLSKWLERAVLPSQEILVDAPHLVWRFPSVCIGDSSRITDLNKSASRVLEETGLDVDKLSDFLFKQSHWLNRPAWWWRRIQDSQTIEEIRDPWSVERPDAVFCEDVSEFLPKAGARDFVADVPTAAPQRWVVDTATEQGSAFADDIKGVAYMPSIQFTL